MTKTLRGIDISNWQAGLQPSRLAVDFVICKASEGLRFRDKTMKGFIQSARLAGQLFGTYHFARNNDPSLEADYYLETIKEYIGKGIMVLDIEDEAIPNWGNYADVFCKRVHDETGIWPLVYTSAAYLPRFLGHHVTKNCGLWLAGYPFRTTNYSDAVTKGCPYSLKGTWNTIAIWQFTSSGRLLGYDEALDLNVAYIDAKQWNAYAGQTTLDIPMPKPEKLVVDGVIGQKTVARLQEICKTPIDGIISNQPQGWKSCLPAVTAITHGMPYGSRLIRAIQVKLGVVADGILGAGTIKVWQKHLGVPVDGILGAITAKAIQERANKGVI